MHEVDVCLWSGGGSSRERCDGQPEWSVLWLGGFDLRARTSYDGGMHGFLGVAGLSVARLYGGCDLAWHPAECAMTLTDRMVHR